MSEYIELKVKVHPDSIAEYLMDNIGLDEEDVESRNMKSEAQEVVDGILGDFLSDYYVIGENTAVLMSDDDGISFLGGLNER